MERREFISTMGISISGVCALCLGACSKSDGPGGGGTGGNVNFNINLGSSLLNVGDSITQSGVIVVRLAAGNDAASFTAVQVACTHEGTSIGFNTGLGIFICPNHGSRFSTTGAVLQGPAGTSLKRFNVAINGSTLTVTG